MLDEGEGTPDSKQVDLVKDFLKSITLVAQASEDLEAELKEGPGGRSRARQRAATRKRIEYAKKVKQKAGLVGIKFKDFTPQQQELYDTAKKDLQQQEEANQFAILQTLAQGKLNDIPMIQSLLEKGGTPLKLALSVVVGEDCLNNLSVDCIVQGIASSPGGGAL